MGHLLCPRWEQDILLGSRDRAGYNTWKDTFYEDFERDSNKLEIFSQYDNYLTKLQNICTENVGEEGKPVYETMKSAIQVFF